MKIIPAILTDDIGQLASLTEIAEGVVSRVQIDIIDNKFAPNSTVDPAVLKNVNTILDLDFHLMVKDPIEWVDHCIPVEISKTNKTRIIGQIEYMENQKNFIEKIESAKCLAGLGVDLATPISKLDVNVLPKVEVILLMSVPAGFAGQQFDLNVWEKIKALVELRKKSNLNFKICIDGGVTKELINEMELLGVNEVAVGKRIFDPDLKSNLADLYNL